MSQIHLFYGTLGCIAALVSSAAWAYGSILFRRLGDEVHPLGMTFIKSLIGILYLGIVILITGIKPVSYQPFLLLSISGLLGITLGDTFFFKALIYLGPRRTVLLGTLGPVFTVILAVFFLGERPSLQAWLGILFIISGVMWVLWEQTLDKEEMRNKGKGIWYALFSAFCISVGIIFAKIGVTSVPTLQATLIRFLGGIIGLTLFGCATRNLGNWMIPFKNNPALLKFAFFTVFVVIFGGFWLFIVALKYIDASIATILNSTTPLFILPMAVLLLKERISCRAILGAVIAVSGIMLIFLR